MVSMVQCRSIYKYLKSPNREYQVPEIVYLAIVIMLTTSISIEAILAMSYYSVGFSTWYSTIYSRGVVQL